MGKRDNMKRTPEVMKSPVAGDHFSEMMSFHVFVLKHEDDQVTYMEARGGMTVPDEGKLIISSYQEFHDHLQYDSKMMKGKYWIDYMGREDDEFVDGCLEHFKEEIDNYTLPDQAILECLGIGGYYV